MRRTRARVEGVADAPAIATVEWQATITGIAQRIRRARGLLGLSQDSLAKLAGVSQGAVSRVERGMMLGLPLLTYVKIVTAVQQAATTLPVPPGTPGIDPALVTPVLSSPPRPEVQLHLDPTLEAMVQTYHDLTPHDREIVEAFFTSLRRSKGDPSCEHS